MTPEQARARAAARLRLQQKQGGAVPAAPEQPSLLSRIGSDLANPGKALQALDDMARIGVDTASFGFADPAIGYLTGENERAKTQAARERAGWAGTGMDVATAIETAPVALTGKVIGVGKGVLPTIGRWLGYGAEGAGQAALSAVGHGETDPGKIAEQAATGAAFGTAGQAIGGKIGSWIERRRAKAAQPFKAAGDVKAASSAKYKQVEQSGAHYPMDQTDTLLKNLDNALVEETATPGLDDRAIAVVNRLKKDWAGKPINPTELDKVRQWIDKKLIAGNPRGPDAQLGYRLKDEIDNFATKAEPIEPVSGQPSPQVAADLQEARSLYARSSRAKAVEGAAEKATAQAKKTGSAITGGNIENTRRQQFTKLQTKIEEGKTGGYSPEEVSRIGQIAKGTVGRNIGRLGGAISPLRGSLPLVANLLSGGTLTPFGAAGEAAALLGQRATSREIEDLAALVRDPTGKGLTTDPAKVQQIRDLLATIMVGGARAGGGP